MAAGTDQESIVVGDLRPAPCAGFGELGCGLDGVERGKCISAGSKRVGVGEHGLHQVREHRAFAGSGAFAGLRDTAIEIGEFRRGEARAVGHALAKA